MKTIRIVKFLSPIVLLLVLLYFAIIGLLIADKSNDIGLLYFGEVTVAIIVIIVVVSAASRVSILQLVNSHNQLLVANSPILSAVYDIKSGAFELSNKLQDVLQLGDGSLKFSDFVGLLPEEDQAQIHSAISTASYAVDWHLTGMLLSSIKDEGESSGKSSRIFKYYSKLLRDTFGNYILCFWFEDITEQSREEEALVRLVQKYRVASFELRQVIEALPIAIWWVSEDGKLQLCNKIFEELQTKYGFNFPEGSPYNWPDSWDKKCMTKERVEVMAVHKVLLPAHLGMVGICSDATAAYNAKRRAQALEGILQSIAENISVGFLVLDHEMRISNFNEAFIRLFPVKPALLAKKPHYSHVLDILRAEHLLPELTGFKEKHLRGIRQVKECATELIHIPNGLSIKVTILPSEDGGSVITYENITPSLELERELTKITIMFDSIVRLIDYPIVIIAQNMQISFLNDKFVEAFLRSSNSSAIPSTLDELMAPQTLKLKEADVSMLKNTVLRCLETKSCGTYEFRLTKASYVAQTLSLDDLSVVLVIRAK